MAKKKKKWKSRIKKALKLAAIGGAGYLAAKAFGGRKGNVSKTAAPKVDTAPVVADTSDSRFDTRFSKPRQELISKAARSQALQAAANAPKGIYPPGSVPMPPSPKGRLHTKFMKKGGRVTGIAKRGFGRALMKGKK